MLFVRNVINAFSLFSFFDKVLSHEDLLHFLWLTLIYDLRS